MSLRRVSRDYLSPWCRPQTFGRRDQRRSGTSHRLCSTSFGSVLPQISIFRLHFSSPNRLRRLPNSEARNTTSCLRSRARRRVGESALGRVPPRRALPCLDPPRLAHAAADTIPGPSRDPQRRHPDATAATEVLAAVGAEEEAEAIAETSVTSLIRETQKYALLVSAPQSAYKGLTCRVQIVVERLTKNVNEDHLYEIFGEYGPIKDLDLPVTRQCESCFDRQLISYH